MAQAYNWSKRFCPTVETGSVLFPKKIRYPSGCPVPYPWSLGKGGKNCPAPIGCALGAITNVQINASAVVTLSSTYVFQGTDRFEFTVSNVNTGASYTFSTANAFNMIMGMGGEVNANYSVTVSPIINDVRCVTFNLSYITPP